MYPYAQDMEGLTSDSQELSEMCAQSLMWRSKPFQSSTWLKRLKRVSWIQPLSSQTLKSSLGNSIVEKWTYSVEASLVSHLARPDEEPEMKTQDTSGPISSEGSESWEDLPLFSLRMSKGSSQVSSKEIVGEIEKERRFCSISLENWRDWVTKQRREYSQRLKLERRTKEKECSSLVLEMTSESQDTQLSLRCLSELVDQEQPILRQETLSSTHGSHPESRWATPTAGDYKMKHMSVQAMRVRIETQRQLGLPGHVHLIEQENWATPASRDWKGHYPKASQERKKRILLPDQAHMDTYRGQLNPRWVETLMGLPIGWTMPSCQDPVIVELMSLGCLEMELCQVHPQKHFKSCLKDWPLHKRLGDEFNNALLSVQGDQLTYDALTIIEIVSNQYEQMINKGELENYHDDHTISEASWLMALDDFCYNHESYYIKDGPVYNYSRLDTHDRS